MKLFTEILRLNSVFLLILMVSCSPPEDPIKCASSSNTNCTITNAYGTFPDRSICRAAQAAYPTTEEELIKVVAEATMAKRKMKVATSTSHSIPKLACTDGEDGLLISTKNLNRILRIDYSAMTMTVESGATLRQVINEAAKVGLALPYTPYWWGMTIGGLLSTGSHGSSLVGIGSAVHEYVAELRLISPAGAEQGYVQVRTLNTSDEDLNAAKVSLGVLGVISQVTLQLQPLFNRSITYKTEDDTDLGDEAVNFGNQHEFADITWYPSQGKAIYRIDDRISSTSSANGVYDFTGFRSTLSSVLELVRVAEESAENNRDANGKCLSSFLTTSILSLTAYGLTNDGTFFTGYPVIGHQNNLQASGTCLDSDEDDLKTACPWDPRVDGQFFFQSTFSIPLSSVKGFIQDVQELVKNDSRSMCGLELYDGVLLRYVKASSAYLGKQEDSIDFDFTYYRSKDPMSPRLYEDFLEEIEQMALFKYGALPHWGKNRNLAFEGAMEKYKNGGKFLEVKGRFDPLGLFSSEWTDQVLGLRDGVNIVKEGCALEGLCICLEDSHCAPEKGYFCRPGKVYKDARVCSPSK